MFFFLFWFNNQKLSKVSTGTSCGLCSVLIIGKQSKVSIGTPCGLYFVLILAKQSEARLGTLACAWSVPEELAWYLVTAKA